MELSEALHILAGDVCLKVGCKDKCKPFVLSLIPGKIKQDSPATWLCSNHIFTLFPLEGRTLLFSHTNQILYFASIDAQLAPNCPDVCFLCQFTMDSPDVPRLLVFDVISNSNPKDRGEMIWNLQGFLPQPLCAVQWIGQRQYLNPEFLKGLPHTIKGLVALGDDPLTPAGWEEII